MSEQPTSQDEAHTARWLDAAGIRQGLRVLDVGAGRGLVATMVAERVGPDGHVVGIEREAKWVAFAEERAQELRANGRGGENQRFVCGDLHDPELDLGDAFDAAVGRRVLKYQPDPVEAVRALARRVRSGGVIAFLEMDGEIAPTSSTALPLHETVRRWIWETVKAAPAHMTMGRSLHAVFRQAGLVDIHVQVEGVVHTPNQLWDVGTVMRFLLPRIVSLGVATEAEVDIETLQERLDAEMTEHQGVFVGELMFGAWGSVP